MKTPLSKRIRPNSEAAPWVVDEVKELEDRYEVAVLQSNIYYQQLEWLEGKNEKMLDAFRSILLDMDNVDRVCDLAGVHPFTGMRSVIQSFVNEGEEE